MQILILDDDPGQSAKLARALMSRGIQAICVESIASAEAVVRAGGVDLLVLVEWVGGRLSHSVALLAGCGDHAVPAIFISDRAGERAAELFDLIPSACSLMGRDTMPATVAAIALAALEGLPIAQGLVSGAEHTDFVPVAPMSGAGAGEARQTQPVAADAAPSGAKARAPIPIAERAAALARLPSPRAAALTLA